MLLRPNVIRRKCTRRNVTEPFKVVSHKIFTPTEDPFA